MASVIHQDTHQTGATNPMAVPEVTGLKQGDVRICFITGDQQRVVTPDNPSYVFITPRIWNRDVYMAMYYMIVGADGIAEAVNFNTDVADTKACVELIVRGLDTTQIPANLSWYTQSSVTVTIPASASLTVPYYAFGFIGIDAADHVFNNNMSGFFNSSSDPSLNPVSAGGSGGVQCIVFWKEDDQPAGQFASSNGSMNASDGYNSYGFGWPVLEGLSFSRDGVAGENIAGIDGVDAANVASADGVAA